MTKKKLLTGSAEVDTDVDLKISGTFDPNEDQILMTYRHENETIVDGLWFVEETFESNSTQDLFGFRNVSIFIMSEIVCGKKVLQKFMDFDPK